MHAVDLFDPCYGRMIQVFIFVIKSITIMSGKLTIVRWVPKNHYTAKRIIMNGMDANENLKERR